MRVIYNLDCTEFFVGTFGPNLPGTIDAFTDEHAALGITDLFINVNAKRTNYRSSVWEAYWDGYDPAAGDEQPFFEGLDPQRRFETELFKNMLALHDQGCDYPARMIDGARRNGQKAWISLRMNDDHSPDLPDHPSHGTLWKSHPEWRLRYGLDYEQPEVREHYLKLIEEVWRALRPGWSRARFSALLALLPRGARASGGGLDDSSRAASAAGDGPGRDAPRAPGRARRPRTVNSLDRPAARAGCRSLGAGGVRRPDRRFIVLVFRRQRHADRDLEGAAHRHRRHRRHPPGRRCRLRRRRQAHDDPRGDAGADGERLAPGGRTPSTCSTCSPGRFSAGRVSTTTGWYGTLHLRIRSAPDRGAIR